MNAPARSRRSALRALLAAPLALALAACGRSGPSVSVATTTSANSAARSAAASSTATGSATTIASASGVPPTAAPTAAPTVAATPTIAATAPPTATPAPSATATPSARATAQALNALFPGSKWDFTRRPILFQIDNAPEARPQNGLSSAYAVYETPAEGGITRFTAVMIAQPSNTIIGDLRSARLVDLDLAPMWDGVLMHVGASTPVENLLNDAKLTQIDLDLGPNLPAAWRSAQRDAPYNLYTSLARLDPFLQKRGIPLDARQPRAFPVGPVPASVSGQSAATFTIPYDAPSTAAYAWDATAGGFLRSVDGAALIDANSGRQIVVANAVIHFAQQIVTDIIEDVEGSHSLKFILVGSGKALLLRDGKRHPLTWRRERPEDLTTYAFADGSPAAFAPGNVWVAIMSDTVQIG